MKRFIDWLILTVLLSGCAGVNAQIHFSKTDFGPAVTGNLSGKFKTVQEFRSVLEAVGYRVTEKAN